MYQMMDGCHGSEVSSFQAALASRTYQDAKDDFVMTDLSAAEATAGRDGLCKALYYRLFTWIINSINERIKVWIAVFNLFQTTRCFYRSIYFRLNNTEKGGFWAF